MNSQFDSVLTVKETAALLKLSPLTVYDYIRLGKLKAVRFGRYYRILNNDLLLFIDDHKLEVSL
jgi:excisionase family DNA binding protein